MHPSGRSSYWRAIWWISELAVGQILGATGCGRKDQEGQQRPTMSAQRLFSGYLRLWSLTNLLRISIGFNKGTGLVGSTLDAGSVVNSVLLPLLILAAGVLPRHWSIAAAAMVLRALTNLMKGSMMSNSQMWATQMDGSVLIALALCLAA